MQQVENFVDSELEHKLDEVIIHCGTNNVENDDEQAILFSSVQFSSVQFSSVQFSSVQFSSVQFSSVQFSSVQFSSVQFSSVQFSSVQFSSVSFISHNTSYLQTLRFNLQKQNTTNLN